MSYRIADFGPSDLLTNQVEGLRRVKTSSEDSQLAASYNGFLYSISGSYSVPAGEKLALNISLASLSVIHYASTNSGLPISVYSEHATGTADGIFAASNCNLSSIDESPATGQLYFSAAPAGASLRDGVTSIAPMVVASFDNKPSVVVTNNTASTQNVNINAVFEEIGERPATLGLTASTLLQPETEMSAYG